MLYLSIFAIAGGLLLIIIAVMTGPSKETEVPSRRVMTDEPDKKRKMNKAGTFSERARYSKKGFPTAADYSKDLNLRDLDEDKLELFSDELDLDLEDFDDRSRKGQGAAEGSMIEFEAVFFEDGSQIIDYSRQAGTIDPSCKEYRKIKRIGQGTLVIEKDGLNFYMGRKFFHFDFQRVSDLRTGENYIAALVEGVNTVKLFIIESNRDALSSVAGLYREFLSMLA